MALRISAPFCAPSPARKEKIRQPSLSVKSCHNKERFKTSLFFPAGPSLRQPAKKVNPIFPGLALGLPMALPEGQAEGKAMGRPGLVSGYSKRPQHSCALKGGALGRAESKYKYFPAPDNNP